MKKILSKLEKWFELNLGWLFTNGNKQEQYCDYLNEKYNCPHGENGKTQQAQTLPYEIRCESSNLSEGTMFDVIESVTTLLSWEPVS